MSPRRPAVLRDADPTRTIRDHLVATAAALIDERGSAGLTVRHIASAAGVADGALYNHFSDKDELLALALREHVRRVMEATRSLPEPGSETVAENLAAFIHSSVATLGRVTPAFLGFLSQPRVVARFHLDFAPETAPEGLPALLANYLRAEQELGRLAADADPAAAATLVIGACHDQVLPLLFQSPGATPEVSDEFVDGLVATLLRGIEPRPA